MEKFIPNGLKRGRGFKVYDFDKMNVGDNFFVAHADMMPDAVTRMASTVCSVNSRYSVPAPNGEAIVNKKGDLVRVMHRTRTFKIERVEKGARIVRVT